MTSVSMDVVTDPSPVNTESAGVEDAESSQGGRPAQPEPGKDLTAEEEALLPNRPTFSRPNSRGNQTNRSSRYNRTEEPWKVLPMGLVNSPAAFCSVLASMLRRASSRSGTRVAIVF